MDYWQLKSFQDNMEFLMDNTTDLHSLLGALKADGVITAAECELLVSHYLTNKLKQKNHLQTDNKISELL